MQMPIVPTTISCGVMKLTHIKNNISKKDIDISIKNSFQYGNYTFLYAEINSKYTKGLKVLRANKFKTISSGNNVTILVRTFTQLDVSKIRAGIVEEQ